MLHLSPCVSVAAHGGHSESCSALHDAVGGVQRLNDRRHNAVALDAEAQWLLRGHVGEDGSGAGNGPVSLRAQNTDQWLNAICFGNSTKKVEKRGQNPTNIKPRKESLSTPH